MLLQQQHKEKRLDEYNKCLRNNLELMNAVDVVGNKISVTVVGTVRIIRHKTPRYFQTSMG